MRGNHPPLPTAIRPIYWLLRTFGTLLGVVGAALAILFSLQGQWASAAWALGLGVPVRIVISLLLSPDRFSYASVTDAVVDVTSKFPQGAQPDNSQ